MVKMQIELNKKQDKYVSIFKVENDCISKADAIQQIVEKHRVKQEKKKL